MAHAIRALKIICRYSLVEFDSIHFSTQDYAVEVNAVGLVGIN